LVHVDVVAAASLVHLAVVRDDRVSVAGDLAFGQNNAVFDLDRPRVGGNESVRDKDVSLSINLQCLSPCGLLPCGAVSTVSARPFSLQTGRVNMPERYCVRPYLRPPPGHRPTMWASLNRSFHPAIRRREFDHLDGMLAVGFGVHVGVAAARGDGAFREAEDRRRQDFDIALLVAGSANVGGHQNLPAIHHTATATQVVTNTIKAANAIPMQTSTIQVQAPQRVQDQLHSLGVAPRSTVTVGRSGMSGTLSVMGAQRGSSDPVSRTSFRSGSASGSFGSLSSTSRDMLANGASRASGASSQSKPLSSRCMRLVTMANPFRPGPRRAGGRPVRPLVPPSGAGPGGAGDPRWRGAAVDGWRSAMSRPAGRGH